MSVAPVAPQPMVAIQTQVINMPSLTTAVSAYDNVGMARRVIQAPNWCCSKTIHKYVNRYENVDDIKESVFHSISVEQSKCCSNRIHVTNFDPATKQPSMEAEGVQGCCACCSDFVAPVNRNGAELGTIVTPGSCCRMLGNMFCCFICDSVPCNSRRIGEVKDHQGNVDFRFLRKYCCSSTVRVLNGQGELVTTVQSASACQRCLSACRCEWKYSPNAKVDLAPIGVDAKGVEQREKILLAMAFFASTDHWNHKY